MWETSTPIRRAPQLPLTEPGKVENPHPRAPILGAPYLPAFYAGRCGKHRRQFAAPPNSRLRDPGTSRTPIREHQSWVPHIYRRFVPVDVGNIDANSPRPPTPAYGTRERREPPSASTNLGAPYLPAFYAGRCGKHRRQFAAPPNSRLRDPGTSRNPHPRAPTWAPHIYRRFMPVDVGTALLLANRSHRVRPHGPKCRIITGQHREPAQHQ